MKKTILFASLLAAFTLQAGEPHPWLHVFSNKVDFHSVKIDGNTTVSHSGTATEDPAITIKTGDSETTIALADVKDCVVGTNIPTMRITIPSDPSLTDPKDKVNYLDAIIEIDGNGVFDDLAPTEVQVRGRGNDTWRYDKKPYRLKFAKKTQLPGCRKAKSYALVANYIDCTLMHNAIAYKAAEMLGMPYSPSCQPVRVYFNGILKGSYCISEKLGISSASVDIDEGNGVLFELDSNYDEEPRFRTEAYGLPVMIKDPDLDKAAAAQGKTEEEIFNAWKEDFSAFAAKIEAGTAVAGTDYDMQSLVDFMLVYTLTGNHEPTHPKSTYLYKKSLDDVYHFGPVWDFDWAYTYSAGTNTMPVESYILDPDPGQGGGYMLIDLCNNDEFRKAFAARWAEFKADMLPQLMEFIDMYADTIRPSTIENGLLWPADGKRTDGTFEFDKNVEALKAWINDRVEFMSTDAAFGLYDTTLFPNK